MTGNGNDTTLVPAAGATTFALMALHRVLSPAVADRSFALANLERVLRSLLPVIGNR